MTQPLGAVERGGVHHGLPRRPGRAWGEVEAGNNGSKSAKRHDAPTPFNPSVFGLFGFMCQVDNVGYSDAVLKFREISSANKNGMFIGTIPYKVITTASVIFAYGCDTSCRGTDRYSGWVDSRCCVYSPGVRSQHSVVVQWELRHHRLLFATPIIILIITLLTS